MEDEETKALARLRACLDRTTALVVCAMAVLAIVVGAFGYLLVAEIQDELLGAHWVYFSATVGAALAMVVLLRGTTAVLAGVLSRLAWGWSEAIAAQHRVSRERLDELLELRDVRRR